MGTAQAYRGSPGSATLSTAGSEGIAPCYPPAMPAALLAVLRFAATLDPRLEEPLRLLAEVADRDTTDGHLGPFFADLPASLGLTLAVAEPPRGATGRYDVRTKTVTVAESTIAEDPRAVVVASMVASASFPTAWAISASRASLTRRQKVSSSSRRRRPRPGRSCRPPGSRSARNRRFPATTFHRLPSCRLPASQHVLTELGSSASREAA